MDSTLAHAPLAVPPGPPVLMVVIDTEEEFDWSAPPNPAARAVTNVSHIPLLQAVFDRHGVRPAYLVDHPVAVDEAAVRVLRGIADAGRGEVGAHLHPWVTPPVEETMETRNAFGCNLPPGLERRKLVTLTDAIAASFGARPCIFKAGGYGLGANTLTVLAELGYKVDSSVVPFTDFSSLDGPNFQDMTSDPFLTRGGLVELPLTAGFAGHLSPLGRRVFPSLHRPLARALHLPGIAARLALLERLRLTPEGHTLQDMVRLTAAARARGQRLFMLALHSSSLLPGATVYVRTGPERDAFLARIDAYLAYFRDTVGGRFGAVSDVAAALASGDLA